MVIAGGSVAGLTAARELRKHFAGDIHVIDRDDDQPYRRPEVSKSLLGNGVEPRKAFIAWPEDLSLTRHASSTLTGLDVQRKCISFETADHRSVELEYDGLLIATGSVAREPSFQHAADCCFTLRTLADARRLRPHLAGSQHVAIIGGGLIGLEVAAQARAMGKRATVVEIEQLPLRRILGTLLAEDVLERHRTSGVEFRLGAVVAEIRGVMGDATVLLESGEVIQADLVVMAVGARPQLDWLSGSGLDVVDGVHCGSDCAVVGADQVVAAGDVARWWHPLYGRQMRVEHWSNAVEQGTFAARRLLGLHDEAGFSSIPYFWSDQGAMKIQVLGSTFAADEVSTVSAGSGSVIHEFRRGGRLVAVAGVDAGTAVLKARSRIQDELSRA
jgi:NADPH-dependent 2,4-dienoyl-CoA reductase/sulfur reductase-like enzyme